MPPRLAPGLGDARVLTTGVLRAAGMSPGRLRRGDLASPGRGLRAVGAGPPARLEMLRALQETTADGMVFSHATAAWIWGMWVPRRLGDDLTVHISMPEGSPARPRRRGVRGHRLATAAETTRCGGLPVTSPAWTWTDVSTLLVPWGRPEKVPAAVEERALEDVVVAGESLMQTPHGSAGRREPGEHPRCTLEDLAAAAAQRRNVRGVRLLRKALPLLRPASGSPAESRIRLRLVAEGFPEPAMNVVLTMADGSWIMPDLVWEGPRICLEYEGDHHRTDAAQFRADIRRVRRLEAAGWICVRVSADVWTGSGMQALVDDLTGAFRRRGVRI